MWCGKPVDRGWMEQAFGASPPGSVTDFDPLIHPLLTTLSVTC